MDLSVWVWCGVPVISAFRMLKSKDREFKASLSYSTKTLPLKEKEKEAVESKGHSAGCGKTSRFQRESN